MNSHLPPIPAKTLEFLISFAGQSVSRQEIVEAVWHHSKKVSKENFYQTIKRLRYFLGDANKPRQYIINSRTNYYALKPIVTITSGSHLEKEITYDKQ